MNTTCPYAHLFAAFATATGEVGVARLLDLVKISASEWVHGRDGCTILVVRETEAEAQEALHGMLGLRAKHERHQRQAMARSAA